jgi:hypothetical protein
MIKKIITLTLIFVAIHFTSEAQESYGKTLNLGLGVGGYSGYYKYAGRSLPVFTANYEFGVAKNLTLAPFISIYTFKDEYYWGNANYPDRYYTYRETVIPIGVKGTYYFDQILGATSNWDFYLAGSLGLAIVNSTWENGYYGDKNYYHGGNSVFLDLHIGTEYHFNNRLGVFLDLSSGVSTIGLAIHGR